MSGVDLAALTTLKPSEFEDAAGGYRSAGAIAAQAMEHLNNVVVPGMRRGLHGEATDAAVGQLQELSKDFHYVQVECGLISVALDAFAAEMRSAQSKLNGAVADAKARNFSVGSDGSVAYPAVGGTPGAVPPGAGTAHGTLSDQARALNRQAAHFDPNPNFGPAQEIADRIAEALKAATDADQKWAPALRKLQADDDLTVSDGDWFDAKGDMDLVRKDAEGYLGHIQPPPKDSDPAHNKTWWEGLSDQERNDYVAMYPASIGGLDGIPATVRDEVNRVVLAETHGSVQGQLDAWLKKEPVNHYRPYIDPYTGTVLKGVQVETDEWKKWNEETQDLQNRLKGMDAISSRMEPSPDGGERGYLLGFDNDKLGHVIVSFGNPDGADNVVTYVPGTGAKLSSVDGDLHRAQLMNERALYDDPGRKTASVMWLGYDAPQSVLSDATETKWADNARESLSKFLTGIDTVNNGNVNSTVMGHSYGTLVAGETLRDHPGLPVDNAIFVGSPGVGVEQAKDLHIPAGHVWSATAKNDLINLAPPNPGMLAPLNPVAYEKFFDDHSVLYGNDPTSDEFGGQVFSVPSGEGWGVDGIPAHSQYWDSKPLASMAKIVTGGKP
ncbi:alpha/beta hydrolase [Streptomyces sp. NPDC052000]|uniref:alpha/beta hydrolase n=1 Tax=Streptomyces sp. NPDC052000 TaxID=3155676 RepID=UPI00344B10B2